MQGLYCGMQGLYCGNSEYLKIISIFAGMLKKSFISIFLIIVYSLILIHDLMPHHHHLGHDYVEIANQQHDMYNCQDCHDGELLNVYQSDDRDHSKCPDSLPCNIPSHMHSSEGKGEFLISNTVLKFDLSLLAVVNFFNNDEQENEKENISYPYYCSFIYKEPTRSAFSLRGPPTA